MGWWDGQSEWDELWCKVKYGKQSFNCDCTYKIIYYLRFDIIPSCINLLEKFHIGRGKEKEIIRTS